MIQKKIKTLWNNLAPIQGKYIAKAKDQNKDLKIVYQDRHMIVANSRLDKPVRIANIPDKFTGSTNELYYFACDPVDPRQKSLL